VSDAPRKENAAEEVLEAFNAEEVVEDPGHPAGDEDSPADDTDAPPT
jgi:hypothetical protein